MYIPEDLKYAKTHEWVRYLDGDKVQVGITDFAQDALGDIVFINLPAVGDDAIMGDPLTDFESVKAVEDIMSPVSGVICAVNEALADAPELINSDPYGAWIAEIEDITETGELMDAAAYEAWCASEGV